MKNPIYRARCCVCKWDGLEADVTFKPYRDRRVGICPGCSGTWEKRRPGESFRRSVLTHYAVESPTTEEVK